MEILRVVEKLETYVHKIFAVMVDEEFTETLTEAAKLLVQQGERITDLEERNRWIPTSVRLPEVGGNYFVVVKYKYDFEKEYSYDTDFAEFTFSDGYIDNCWNTYNDWNEGQQYLHITHWMPIPEPPREGA